MMVPCGARVVALAAAMLLGACTSPGPPPALPVPGPEARVERPAPDVALQTFEEAQVDQARADEARGHWASAALAWEVVTLLRPGDEQARTRLAELRRRIDALASERQAAAEAAQRRGELDAATQAYLEVLALDPRRRAAADALRQIERDRGRRSLVGRFARPVAPRRPDGEMVAPDTSESGRSANNVREHATMLVRQGDLDGAIQLLRDATATRNDTGQRALLADLYVQRAEALKLRQPDAARASVEAALAIDRRHAGALALQQQLRPATRPKAVPGR
jgi:tetratricopeptide (TPR) repeat protein